MMSLRMKKLLHKWIITCRHRLLLILVFLERLQLIRLRISLSRFVPLWMSFHGNWWGLANHVAVTAEVCPAHPSLYCNSSITPPWVMLWSDCVMRCQLNTFACKNPHELIRAWYSSAHSHSFILLFHSVMEYQDITLVWCINTKLLLDFG